MPTDVATTGKTCPGALKNPVLANPSSQASGKKHKNLSYGK
jgi:hypothetical protein